MAENPISLAISLIHPDLERLQLLLALGAVPARAPAEDDLRDGGPADRTPLLRVDLQLLDELPF